jgi:hypothetical protein
VDGKAREISIGPDGSVWVIGGDSVGGGSTIWRWTGETWEQVEGAGTRIAAGRRGHAWVVNGNNDIFQKPER